MSKIEELDFKLRKDDLGQTLVEYPNGSFVILTELEIPVYETALHHLKHIKPELDKILEATGRGTGKTKRAVELAMATGAYLVVRNRDEAHRLSQEYPKLRFPVTFQELKDTRMQGSFVRNIVIDDLEDFKNQLLFELLGGLALENEATAANAAAKMLEEDNG